METLFIFIAKSSGLVAMFYIAYYFLLRKETFFNSNRWFLLAGLTTSVVLPFLVYTKVVWVDPVPVSNWNYTSDYIQKTSVQESFEINWHMISIAIYALGFLAFMTKFAMDFYSLNLILKGKKIEQQADFKFIDLKENIAPFSYFDYIVYNSSMYTDLELESILEHEKVHSDQNHTVDVLISKAFCILFWFNPIIWLYKKAILQNLEYIADNEAAKKISDKKAYQYTLLKITTHESCVAITNHFYQSLIKKRIVMLNKNQSKKRNYWKYYVILPVLVAFVFLFQIETIAQEKKEIKKEIQKTDSVYVLKFQKNTTDQELKEIAEKLKKDYNFDMLVSNLKRNSKDELTAIKVEVKKQNEEDQTIQIEGNEPIKSCGIVIITDKKGSKKVNFIANGDNNKEIVFESHNHNNHTEPTPPTPPIPPTFPTGPMPQAPSIDMSKMPSPPVPPSNLEDKTAMKDFEKKMADFEKKMANFQPDMSSFEKEMDEVMEKRSAIFEKEMEKYEIAMEKFNIDMEKFTEDIQEKYGKHSKEYEINMKQFENDMKVFEKSMKLHEKEMKKMDKASKRS